MFVRTETQNTVCCEVNVLCWAAYFCLFMIRSFSDLAENELSRTEPIIAEKENRCLKLRQREKS